MSVEITLDNTGRGLSFIDDDLVRIKKTLTPGNKVQIEVNCKLYTQDEFLTLLAHCGYQTHMPLNFVLQGKAKQISQLDQTGLFNLFCKIVGTATYSEARLESESMLASTVLDERKSMELLEDFRERLSDLEVDREDFQKFESNLKQTNSIYHVLYDRKIKKNRIRIEQAIQQLEELKLKLRSVYSKELDLKQELEQVSTEMRDKESELAVVQSTTAALRKDMGKMSISSSTMDEIESLNLDSPYNLDHSSIGRDIASLKKQRDSLATELLKADREQKSLRESVALVKTKLFSLRSRFSQNPQLTSNMIESKVALLKDEINKRRVSMQELSKRHESHRLSIEERTKAYVSVERSKEEIATRLPKIIEDIAKNREIKNDISAQLITISSDICAIKQSLSENLVDIASKKKRFSTKHSDISVAALVKLIEEAKKRGIPGVHGILIDLIELPNKLYMAFEKLMAKRLFSIVVEDEHSAAALINLNKEIKGGRVNIYPLTWSKEEVDDFLYPDPETESCIILESSYIITPKLIQDQSFINLVKSVTRGNLLVDKITDAQKLAKKFDCNCVTMEGEVIYRGAILNKLGFSEYQEKLIPDYMAFSSLLKRTEDLQTEVRKLESKKSDFQQAESLTSLKLQELGTLKSSMLRQNEEIWEELVLLKKTNVHEQRLISDCREQTIEEEKSIELINKEIIELESELRNPKRDEHEGPAITSELSLLEDKISTESDKLSAACKLVSNLITQLSKVESDIEALSIRQLQADRLTQVVQNVQNQNKLNSALVTKGHQQTKVIEAKLFEHEQRETNLKFNVEKIRGKVTRLTSEIEKIHTEVAKVSSTLQEANQRRFDLQMTIDNFESKMRALGIDEKSEEERLWALGKLNDKELIERLKRQMMAKLKYTQKDRTNFEKLEEHFKVYGEYNSEIKELNVSKKTFSKILGNLL